MADIIPFKKRPQKKLGLCQYGHHRWQVIKDNEFDTKQGKLVTVYKCSNCGKRKTKSE